VTIVGRLRPAKITRCQGSIPFSALLSSVGARFWSTNDFADVNLL
jgi:hypothetical protein